MKNFRYSAKFIILSKLIYECHDLGSSGGGGGIPIFPQNARGVFPPLPSGQECIANSSITTVNIEKHFLLPQIINVNDSNQVVSTSDLQKNGIRVFNPLSLVMNLDVYQSPNSAPPIGPFGTMSYSKFSDNMMLMSDLTDLELAPGVYDFEKYLYPIAGDLFLENRRVTQYLFYYEKN